MPLSPLHRSMLLCVGQFLLSFIFAGLAHQTTFIGVWYGLMSAAFFLGGGGALIGTVIGFMEDGEK